jgi:hypothetical protein
MQIGWFSGIRSCKAAVLLAALGFCRPGISQEVAAALLPPAPMAAAAMVTVYRPTISSEATNHRFWDRENSILLAASTAFSAADFVITKDNLHGGGQELNPVTRMFAGNTPALAMNFAGEAAGVVGLSYLFHRTRHHKLERAISMLNIGASGAALTFDLAHR